MKRLFKSKIKWIIICLIVLLIVFSPFLYQAYQGLINSEYTCVIYYEGDYLKSFNDTVKKSDAIVIAECCERIRDGNMFEYKFNNITVIYGDVKDSVISVIDGTTYNEYDENGQLILLPMDKFSENNRYLIPLRRYTPYKKSTYLLTDGTVINLSNLNDSYWEKGKLVFSGDVSEENIIDYVKRIAEKSE